MITLKNVIPIFQKDNFCSFSFDLEPGKIVLLNHKSGTGKSSLFKILAGHLKIQFHGSIIIDGIKFDSVDYDYFRDSIAYLDQEYTLFPHMTIFEQLLQPLILHSSNKQEAEKQVIHFLDTFNMTELKSRYPNELSGGQKQRIALIKVLLLKRQYILLDEPTSGVDLKNKEIIATALLETLQEKSCLCISTHDNEFINILISKNNNCLIIKE